MWPTNRCSTPGNRPLRSCSAIEAVNAYSLPVPVSNTGYRCHFARMEDVKASASPKDYAREVVLDMMHSERRGKPELAVQLPLF